MGNIGNPSLNFLGIPSEEDEIKVIKLVIRYVFSEKYKGQIGNREFGVMIYTGLNFSVFKGNSTSVFIPYSDDFRGDFCSIHNHPDNSMCFKIDNTEYPFPSIQDFIHFLHPYGFINHMCIVLSTGVVVCFSLTDETLGVLEEHGYQKIHKFLNYLYDNLFLLVRSNNPGIESYLYNTCTRLRYSANIQKTILATILKSLGLRMLVCRDINSQDFIDVTDCITPDNMGVNMNSVSSDVKEAL